MDLMKVMSSTHCPNMRKQVADPRTAFAVLLKLPWAAEQIAGLCELNSRLFDRQRLAVESNQFGLVVKRVDMRRTAVHEEEDDSFRPRRKMSGVTDERIAAARGGGVIGID